MKVVEAEEIGGVEAEMGVVEAEEIEGVEAEMGVEEVGGVEAEMGVVERQKIEVPGMEAVGTGSEIGNGRNRFTSLFALRVKDHCKMFNSS